MTFFNIFCGICTDPDNVNMTSEVFDKSSELFAHMRQLVPPGVCGIFVSTRRNTVIKSLVLNNFVNEF